MQNIRFLPIGMFTQHCGQDQRIGVQICFRVLCELSLTLSNETSKTALIVFRRRKRAMMWMKGGKWTT